MKSTAVDLNLFFASVIYEKKGGEGRRSLISLPCVTTIASCAPSNYYPTSKTNYNLHSIRSLIYFTPLRYQLRLALRQKSHLLSRLIFYLVSYISIMQSIKQHAEALDPVCCCLSSSSCGTLPMFLFFWVIS